MSTTPLNLPCVNTVNCFPCYVSPIANLTSEAPDGEIFIGESWTDATQIPFTPTIGTVWTATGCLGLCTSGVSQDAANLCAENQVAQCTLTHNPGLTLFPNNPQTCVVLCPDGSPFSFTVPAGIITLSSQAAADSAAYQYACRQAALNRICFGSLAKCTCVGLKYSSTVTVTGGRPPINYSVFSGQIPPGLGLFGGAVSFTISGTPTQNGTFTFTIQGVDAFGNFMRKSFTIVVIQITTTTIPPYTVGVPFSFQLVTAGGSGNYAYKISSGALPNGLSMSLTGLISGTPTQ